MSNYLNTQLAKANEELNSPYERTRKSAARDLEAITSLIKLISDCQGWGFTVEEKLSDEGEFRAFIIASVLYVPLRTYNPSKQYMILADRPTGIKKAEIGVKPNNIGYNKATKSKIQDWIDYAKAVIDRSIEVDQADKNKIAETKDKIKKLYDLAGKEFNTESDQGSLEINNFIFQYKIEGSGYVNTKIHLPSYKVDQISLFEALMKGGF